MRQTSLFEERPLIFVPKTRQNLVLKMKIFLLFFGLILAETLSRKIASQFLSRQKRKNTWHHTEGRLKFIQNLFYISVHLWTFRNFLKIEGLVLRSQTVSDFCDLFNELFLMDLKNFSKKIKFTKVIVKYHIFVNYITTSFLSENFKKNHRI